MNNFVTKDSGAREQYKSGMVRDLEKGKPRFDLIIPKGQKFDETILYRWAMLMARGAEKYGDRNWEKANNEEELSRYLSSAIRHFMQWFNGETDEDHAVAVFFNITAAELVKARIKK